MRAPVGALEVRRLEVRRLEVRRLGRVPYQAAWQVQRDLHEQRVAGEVPDVLLLLEHDSVYTAGRRTLDHERPPAGVPVVDVDRGGKITWHGPGQLVGYPIVRLSDPVDVVAHVRRLEAALIAACGDIGVPSRRVVGRSGVWTTDGARKLAAIGVRVSRGVTLHGFALNCNPDLRAFDSIVPCGISDAGVSSLTAELGRPVTVAEALPVVAAAVGEVLSQ